MVMPRLLYKYESLNVQSLKNLKSQVLYFGSPLKFNDPYDCAIRPNIRQPSDLDVEKIRSHYLSDSDVSANMRQAFLQSSVDELRGNFLRAGRQATEKTVEEFLKNRGATCFSEHNDDLLMWSHYGERYQGICLEFSTSFEPFHLAKKVSYRSDIPAVDLVRMLCNDDYDESLNLFFTKSTSWAYEQEWRCIHHVAGTAFTYKTESLTGVYFGPDIGAEMLEIVCLILAGQNETVKLWSGARSPSEFKVVFEPFTYASHLEAKRQGLSGA